MNTTTRTVSGTLSEEERLHVALSRTLRENGASPEGAIALLGKVAQEGIWKHLPRRGHSESHFTSFTDYVEAPTDEGGLGMLRKDVLTLLEVRTEVERRPGVGERAGELAERRKAVWAALDGDIKETGERGGDRRSEEFQSHAMPLNHHESNAGILARLKNDDPELAAAVMRKEITANAAARKKGWRPPRIELRNPVTIATKIREHLSPDEIEQLIQLLTD